MSSRYPGLTFEQHLRYADELKRIRHQLMSGVAGAETENLFPKTSKAVKMMHRAINGIDDLRCELDNVLARDFPREFHPNIYYGSVIRKVGGRE